MILSSKFNDKFADIMRWLLRAAALQGFLTLTSLPILVAWGLPLSYLAPIGTVLFTPLLTLYLWCALAVFFTTLCRIPNSYCLLALHHVGSWWLWVLKLIKTPWQIGFVCPPLLVLICIPMSAFGLVWYLRGRSLASITCGISLLLCGWIIVLKMMPHQNSVIITHTNGKSITALYDQNRTLAIDSESCCSSLVDSSNWIAYHALPEITKQMGSAHIDQFIVMHPRQRTFEALATLVQKGLVHSVQVLSWKGHIPRNAWFAYKKLQELVTSYGYTFERITLNTLTQLTSTLSYSTVGTKKYGDAVYESYTLHIHT